MFVREENPTFLSIKILIKIESIEKKLRIVDDFFATIRFFNSQSLNLLSNESLSEDYKKAEKNSNTFAFDKH